MFLAGAESRIYSENSVYSECIAKLIEHIVSLDASQIESEFLSANYTARQEKEIELALEMSDLQVVRDFWQRKSIKGVGRAIRLNWEGQT